MSSEENYPLVNSSTVRLQLTIGIVDRIVKVVNRSASSTIRNAAVGDPIEAFMGY